MKILKSLLIICLSLILVVLIMLDGWQRFNYVAILSLILAIIFCMVLAYELFETEKDIYDKED